MSAEVLKLSGAALCLAPPIDGLLAHDNFRPDTASAVNSSAFVAHVGVDVGLCDSKIC